VAQKDIGRRLLSLSGVVPLAFFLVEHTWANATAMRGQDAYVATVDALEHIPLLPVVEIVFVFVPLAFHALYGAWTMRLPVSEKEPPYGRRLALANRAAAIGAFVFIVWHFGETRFQAFRGLDPRAFHATLAAGLSSTWHGFPARATLYLAGVTAAVAHLAISAWGFGVTAGYFTGKRQKRRAAWACAAIGSLLFVTSAATVVSLATGVHFASTPKPSATCAPK
jgi:succinate dehydrogenase / fumarate reductase cytochrome b subunit